MTRGTLKMWVWAVHGSSYTFDNPLLYVQKAEKKMLILNMLETHIPTFKTRSFKGH